MPQRNYDPVLNTPQEDSKSGKVLFNIQRPIDFCKEYAESGVSPGDVFYIPGGGVININSRTVEPTAHEELFNLIAKSYGIDTSKSFKYSRHGKSPNPAKPMPPKPSAAKRVSNPEEPTDKIKAQ